MDLATLLARVDARTYLTTAHFLADAQLIVQAERDYYGAEAQGSGEKGSRLVSKAQELVVRFDDYHYNSPGDPAYE